jgi:predicted O-methyltransferase YrrM
MPLFLHAGPAAGSNMFSALRKAFARTPAPAVTFVQTGTGWLSSVLTHLDDLPPPAEGDEIERRAAATNGLGPQPLWQGYRDVAGYPRATSGSRSANEVRSDAGMGRFFAWLAAARRPYTIVEFGTAFGVSGMYWLAGLKAAGRGMLFSFEPNAAWAAVARENLAAISNRYRLTVGTFEDHVEAELAGRSIDIAFVDAIHTGSFVRAQYAILRRHTRRGSLILFDDIDFSGDMRACWTEIAAAPEVATSAQIGGRLGIVELAD